MSRRQGPLLTLCLVLMCAPGFAAAMEAPDILSRLARTLETGPQAGRADFATVALGEMINAYEAEFDKLNLPGQVSRGEMTKQLRWGRAVHLFLDELYAARDELDAGASVELLLALPNAVQLLIGDRLVAVGSPRIDRPQLLGQQIVQVYCDSFACDPEVLDPPVTVLASSHERGAWSFAAGMGSTYETGDGLSFMFTSVRNRNRKEQVCLQIGAELGRLSDALARARLHGRQVDMQAVRINSSGRGDDQLVVLSASGDTLRLALPALMKVPGVLEVARDWLAARSEGNSYRQRFPRAELLMAALLAER